MKQYIVTLDPPLIPITLLPDEGTRTLITKKTILGRRYKNPECSGKKEKTPDAVCKTNSRTGLRVTPQNLHGTSIRNKRISRKRHRRSHSILQSKNICRKLVESNQTRSGRVRSRQPFKSRFNRIQSMTKRNAETGVQKIGEHHQKDEEGVKEKLMKIKRIKTADIENRRARGSSEKRYIRPLTGGLISNREKDHIENRRIHESHHRGWRDKERQDNKEQLNDRKQISETEERGRIQSMKLEHGTISRIKTAGTTRHRVSQQSNENGQGNERNTDLELWLRRIGSGILDTNQRLFGCKKSNHLITRRRVNNTSKINKNNAHIKTDKLSGENIQ